MDDLRRRFATLDRVPAPDLWESIERQATDLEVVARVTATVGPAAPRSRRSTGASFVLILVTVTVLVALVAGAVATGSLRLAGPTLVPARAPSSPVTGPTGDAQNGWIAFTVAQDDGAGDGPDIDIWFTAFGAAPRRVVGTDTDAVDQVCPALSPNGDKLAFASLTGIGDLPLGASGLAAYRDAAVVLADVAGDGTVTERRRIEVGDRVPPPCPVWSPGGDRLAFGVARTSAIKPGPGDGSQVWVLRSADGDVTVVPDLLATDLAWSPDGSVLAIAGGVVTAWGPDAIEGVQDSSIHLFEPSTGWLRTLDDTIGVGHLAWSPNDERIAYEGRGPEPDSSAAYDSRGGLRIVDAQTGEQDVLADAYRSIHGIGPVWSPDGKQLAYQRSISGEHHEVVVIAPDGRSGQSAPMAPADEVALPVERSLADGSRMTLNPWRVSWSPDARYLLYVAWTNPTEDTEQTVLAAVPTDPGAAAQVLADMDGIGAYDFADDAMRVSFQVWAPR